MTSRTYRFGEFEVHGSLFELRRGEQRVALQPKALDLLLYLVRNPDRVVLKDELLAHVWPGVTVSEASLSKAVAAVRRAIGDSGGAQSHIQTVRGRGFRFVAAVAACDSAPAAVAPQADAGGIGSREAENDFVGRGDVLDAIADAFAGACRGAGRVILLTGEAGMGKTRAAQEAAARCRQAGGRTLLGWCAKGEGTPALWPWVQVVRQLTAEHEHALSALGDVGNDLITLLRPPLTHASELTLPAAIEPEQARFRFCEAVTRLLHLASRDTAHVLILDDFQWADASSLLLLEFLSHTIRTSRLVLLVTYRQEDLPDESPLYELFRRPGCEARALEGLDRADVARLLASELRTTVDEGMVEMIHQRTDGNPFFVKELARSFAHGARDSLSHAVAPVPLPAGISEVLRQRLDRLAPECVEVLLRAAAIGREVDLGLLAGVADLTPDVLLKRLDEAAAARLIRCDVATLAFVHGLVRDALLEQLPSAERARVHRRIAEALERRHRDDLEPHLSALAYHFSTGAPSGCVAQAIAYCKRAGERAARALAVHDAVTQYRRALELYALRGVAEERLHCELLLALGEALVSAGQADPARAPLRQAADIARRLGAAELLARAALASGGLELATDQVVTYDPELIALLEEALVSLPREDGALRVRLLVRTAIALASMPDVDRCTELIGQAVASARRLGDPVALAHALYVHRWSLRGPGETGVRVADCDEMLQLAQRARRRDLEIAALSSRFVDLMEIGRLAEADRDLDAYDRLAGELGVPRYRWRAQLYRIMRAVLEGRFATADEMVGSALADAQRFGFKDAGPVHGSQLLAIRAEQARLAEIEPALRALVDAHPAISGLRASLAFTHAEMGDLAAARDDFEAYALGDFQDVPRDHLWLGCLVILSEVCCRFEDAPRAVTLLEMLRPYAPRTVMIGIGVLCLGALDRQLGSLALTAGDWGAAARHLDAALRMNTRIGARAYVGWTHYDWARLLRRRGRRGDREEAYAHLTRARETAASLGMVRLGRRVDALATELGDS
jgi:DNA-binding winged helix-turn-helix (wHTH) protein/tetratricopeptide (TPR) repeat protein